jgi:hypothetical protein
LNNPFDRVITKDDFEQAAGIGFQHDEVAGRLRFEFEQHAELLM